MTDNWTDPEVADAEALWAEAAAEAPKTVKVAAKALQPGMVVLIHGQRFTVEKVSPAWGGKAVVEYVGPYADQTDEDHRFEVIDDRRKESP